MAEAWNYFNGTQHGWNDSDGYIPPKPMTHAYCWECGPKLIPGFDHEAQKNDNPYSDRGHYGTGFKCAPWRIGRPCDGCGKDI